MPPALSWLSASWCSWSWLCSSLRGSDGGLAPTERGGPAPRRRLPPAPPPLAPGHGAVSPALAFHPPVSFATNTNWQNYSGEQTLGYGVQMAGLTVQNFVSAAGGVPVAPA